MIWLAVVGLAIACTGVAYLLIYRLISRIGAHQTVSVTFLVLFGVANTTGRLRPGQIVRSGES